MKFLRKQQITFQDADGTTKKVAIVTAYEEPGDMENPARALQQAIALAGLHSCSVGFVLGGVALSVINQDDAATMAEEWRWLREEREPAPVMADDLLVRHARESAIGLIAIVLICAIAWFYFR